jgi:hypothetical protein
MHTPDLLHAALWRGGANKQPDGASSDSTGEIARAAGAMVILYLLLKGDELIVAAG